MKPVLLLCLGNELLSDDGLGAEVAKRLSQNQDLPEFAEVIFAATAGFQLIDLLENRQRVLIVDTIRTGKAIPGTLLYFGAGIFTPSHRLTNSHQISLPTALEFGKLLGLNMPSVVEVIAVEAEDLETLHEGLSASVQSAVEIAIHFVENWIIQNQGKVRNHGRRKRQIPDALKRRAEDLPRVPRPGLGG